MEKTFLISQLRVIWEHMITLKIARGQGDYYGTVCLLEYNYFNKDYKMIAIDLSKQQALDADPDAI